jgi:hypothetical protein
MSDEDTLEGCAYRMRPSGGAGRVLLEQRAPEGWRLLADCADLAMARSLVPAGVLCVEPGATAKQRRGP